MAKVDVVAVSCDGILQDDVCLDHFFCAVRHTIVSGAGVRRVCPSPQLISTIATIGRGGFKNQLMCRM